VAISQRELPHWRQAGVTYFVTFRLVDAVPQAWVDQQPRQSHGVRAIEQYQAWLDQGHGACWLRQPAVAQIVANALRHFDGERYALGKFVIMPNHVHALVTPMDRYELAEILHSWKSFTAHAINKLLQRSGRVWQDESYDHILRDAAALARLEEYIRDNPRAGRLQEGEYILG
jgi:type I restriction enzyme R subunit